MLRSAQRSTLGPGKSRGLRLEASPAEQQKPILYRACKPSVGAAWAWGQKRPREPSEQSPDVQPPAQTYSQPHPTHFRPKGPLTATA